MKVILEINRMTAIAQMTRSYYVHKS